MFHYVEFRKSYAITTDIAAIHSRGVASGDTGRCVGPKSYR